MLNDEINNKTNDDEINNKIDDYNDNKLYVENTNNFKVLIIEFGKIDHLEWNREDYLSKLFDLDIFRFVETNGDNLTQLITEELETNKYICDTLTVTTDRICEDKEYMYEMMFIDVDDGPKINDAATLINTNDIKIYSKAIVFKSYLPENSDSMIVDNITKEDMINLLEIRVSTNIVLYEPSSFLSNKKNELELSSELSSEFREMKVCGDLNKFAEEFFDGEGFIKTEFKFLLYDISIWYTTDSGSKNIFSKLINNPVYSCIIFMQLSDDIRGSISLNEVNKIINLSHKLSSFEVPEEYEIMKRDKYNRNIIDNKYRLLSKLYSKYN